MLTRSAPRRTFTAWGAILYELLACRPMHTGSVTRVLFKLVNEVPIRPGVVQRC